VAVVSTRRHQFMLSNEAFVINNAANADAETAVDVAQGVIDGCANGMVRLQGLKPTAEFLFALADRVVGGVLQPTESKISEPFDPGPLKLKPLPWWERAPYAWGVMHGATLVLLVLIAMRRL
jgi:hypothetical protein